MKLIRTLKTVIDALKKDVITYEWNSQSSCNCGLIAQVILNKTPKAVKEAFKILNDELRTPDEKKNNKGLTWKDAVKRGCSVTGLSDYQIINSLKEGGLRPEDMVHLEYMENKAILKEAGIDTTIVQYFTKRDNLILYLEAWVRILESKPETHSKTDKKIDIERSLLIAVAEENYEKAAELRDLMVTAPN